MAQASLSGNGGGVKDATFVTRTLPDITSTTGLVGLCTVPEERANQHDLGWHVSDFLALKTLLGKRLHPKAQTWLSHCNIATVVEADPNAYAHGRDRRVFCDRTELTSDIQVEPSADKLIATFIENIKGKAEVIKKFQYDLVIIVCGPTNLEQDIYFGTPDYMPCIRSTHLRDVMSADEGNFRAVVITPAQFSAGWQINPCFCKDDTFRPRTDTLTLMARQFGAIFAKPIAEKVLGWDCPMIDSSKVDPETRRCERYPGPVPLPNEHRIVMEKVHKVLAGRLAVGHDDHSFSFDTATDEWEKLIGPRRGETLDAYKQEWDKLGVATGQRSGMPFLGNLFGGTRFSQLAHIEHLVMESLTTWQGVWTDSWGRTARSKFQQFLDKGSPDDSDCHEMFNVMEQRASLLVMADLVVKHLELPVKPGERCRDYTETAALSGDVGTAYDQLCGCIPWVGLDMDRGVDRFSHVQNQHRRQAQYLAAVLGRAHENPAKLKADLHRILNLLQVVQVRQLELLFEDQDFNDKCKKWLAVIGVPMRDRPAFGDPTKETDGSSQNGKLHVMMPLMEVTNAKSTATRAHENQSTTQSSHLAQSRHAAPPKSMARLDGLLSENANTHDPQTTRPTPESHGRHPLNPKTQSFVPGNSGQGEPNAPARDNVVTQAEPSIRERCMAFMRGEHGALSLKDLPVTFHECPDLTQDVINYMTRLGAGKGNAS